MAENYREYGRTVIDGELLINGKLTLGDGATLTGLPNATTQKAGVVKKASKVTPVETGDSATAGANATAINEIISALQTAGVMVSGS